MELGEREGNAAVYGEGGGGITHSRSPTLTLAPRIATVDHVAEG